MQVFSSPDVKCMNRRNFLQTASATAGSLLVPAFAASQAPTTAPKADHCILINLVGGPSQLDTFDLKPSAPSNIRGPFRPIATRVPGIQISEILPRLACAMDRVALVRSVYHDEAPIHETGQQLVQTGTLTAPGSDVPHVGAIISHARPSLGGLPGWVVTPGLIQNTGVSVGHGQEVGVAGQRVVCRTLESVSSGFRASDLENYGDTMVGHGCLTARCLVEQGARFVAVNMFDTVFNQPTWDSHADGASLRTTFGDVRGTVAPAFDLAFTSLLGDLERRGLLSSTLVVATGEFGRTPWINRRGGRDHWPGVWTALFAGGGVRGGQVVGRSDNHGATPVERPVPAAAIAATMMYALDTPAYGQGAKMKVKPILELF